MRVMLTDTRSRADVVVHAGVMGAPETKVAVFFTVSAVLGYTLKRNRNGRRTDGQS